MSEELIHFTNEGLRLYGMLHRPDMGVPYPAVMILHGFTGQRVEPHRIFVKLARRLMAEGIAALRFDFRGSGESEGEFADMTILGEVSDALAGLDWLATQPGIDPDRLGVLGLSLGGCVAAITAGRRSAQVKALALWSAVAELERSFQQVVGPQPERVENGYDMGGNVLGDAFLAELPRVQPLAEVARYSGPALIVHGTRDEVVPPADADAYEAALPGKVIKHLIIDADHTYNRERWEREVLQVSVDFFKDVLLR